MHVTKAPKEASLLIPELHVNGCTMATTKGAKTRDLDWRKLNESFANPSEEQKSSFCTKTACVECFAGNKVPCAARGNAIFSS